MREKTYIKMPGIVWFGVFLVYVLLHGFYPGGNNWFSIAAMPLKVYILFLLIINLFKTKREYITLGISFVSLAIIALIIYYIRANQLGWHGRVYSEGLGFHINANTISYLAVLGFIIYIFMVRGKHSNWRLFSKLCLLIGASAIVSINASVGAFLLLTSAVLLTMPETKNRRVFLLSICLILVFAYLFYKYHPNTGAIFDRIIHKVQSYPVGSRHIATKKAFSMFLDAPLWGKGYDSIFSYRQPPTNHLWYLNVLVAYGVFGLLFLFIWFIRIIPVKTLFASRYSLVLTLYIFVFLLLGPPMMFFSVALAFLYQERPQICKRYY